MLKYKKKNFIEIFPLLLLIIYLILSFYYAHHLDTTMDEGTYLLKGRLFLEGKFHPFEIKGLLTNKLPFSFWILGLSQIIKTGLRSGRYFAIILSLGVFIGIWITSKKYFNEKIALFNCLLITLNQAIIMYYSRAMTEVVTAFLIIWSLYFLLGSGHNKFDLSLGLLLAVIISLTRQNLIPFYIFSLVYVIWENKLSKAWLPILVSILFFIGFNVYYWPSIYIYIWRFLFPQRIQLIINSFFNIDLSGDLGSAYLDRNYGIIQELQVLFQTLRYYFIPIVASIFSFFLVDWETMKKGKSLKKFLYLLSCFLFLVLIHILAPFYNNDYLYSMPAYPAFFIPIGLFILPLGLKYFKKTSRGLITVLLIVLILILFSGYGLSLYRAISEPLMKIKVPRIKDFSFQEGSIELWKLLSNKFQIDYFKLEYVITTAFGFFIGIIFLTISIITWRIFLRKKFCMNNSIFFQLVLIYILFLPTKYVAGSSSINLCTNGDVIASHENVAKELIEVIPNGSLVYFETNESSIPLLYLTKDEFFPNLLNQQFYRRIGGEDDYLEELGYWNESLARKWISEADYLVLGEDEAKYWEPRFDSEFYVQFDKILITDNLIPCRDRTYLHVYKVIK